MKWTAITMAIVLGGSILAAWSAEKPPPPWDARVELRVRGPDGKPLSRVQVELVGIDADEVGIDSDMLGRTRLTRETGRTDGEGRVRVRWPAGVWQMKVTVPKMAYGVTGEFRALSGQTVEAPLAPLILYAPPAAKVESKKPKRAATVLKPAPERTPKRDDHGPTPKAGPWAQGVVTDEAGKPLAGAKVYALAMIPDFHGGHGELQTTTADADGKYQVDGRPNPETLTLVAHQPGKVAGWGLIDQTGSKVDFVLSKRGGKLNVTVVRDGKPVPKAKVILSREGATLRDRWNWYKRTPEENELADMADPVQETNPDGLTCFDLLTPGRYRVTATTIGQPEESYGVAEGVAVRAGKPTSHRMVIFPRAGTFPMRVLRQDGQPLTGHPPYEYHGVTQGGRGWTAVELDRNGVGRAKVGSLGFWHEEFVYGPLGAWRPIPEPHAAVVGHVAVSPSLTVKEPVRFTGMPIEAGPIIVELKDAAGKPAAGTVMIGEYFNVRPWVIMGSAGSSGVVEFKGVPMSQYVIKARTAGCKAPEIGGGPMPDDDELTDVAAIPWAPVESRPGAVQRFVLQEQKVGYVLGVLKPPTGLTTRDYNVFLRHCDYYRGIGLHYEPGTGEFVAGPFLPGVAHLQTGYEREIQFDVVPLAQREVTIEAGKVATVQWTPPAPPKHLPPERAMLGVDNWVSLYQAHGATNPLRGAVVLPDGKTPAWGAMVRYFMWGNWTPTLQGMTDARGQIMARTAGGGYDRGDGSGGSLIVAWLPGAHGAAIVPVADLSKPVRVVLPPALRATGKVTVGGAAPTGRAAQIRVRAAYQGRDRLDDLLSVEAMAQEDGSFELAGLTPGRYRIQAALDDLWLSDTLAVEVKDKDFGPLTLVIGAPGTAVRLKFVDQLGKPRAGLEVVIHPPTARGQDERETHDKRIGPLGARLWPKQWMADGAGELYVPSLTVGTWEVQADRTWHVEVKPAIDGHVQEETLKKDAKERNS